MRCRLLFTLLLCSVAGWVDMLFAVPVTGNYGGHDYVDLGLASGTFWATCNVGAASPVEFGQYLHGVRRRSRIAIVGCRISSWPGVGM